MGILNTMNSLNNGKGIRWMLDAGTEELQKKVKEYKRKNKIHWKKDVFDEDWYKEMEKEIYRPMYQGIYWDYARVTKR